nr:ribonuclease H-like domain, reverse transcriptase, RNA-dependent DNA polymerase [Tanacetum cinerariifolium]
CPVSSSSLSEESLEDELTLLRQLSSESELGGLLLMERRRPSLSWKSRLPSLAWTLNPFFEEAQVAAQWGLSRAPFGGGDLIRMGYEKPPPKLTFYKAFFSAQWKFLIHTLVQCVSAKRTSWNEFSCSMASAVICLATGRKFNFSKYIFDSMAAAEEDDEEDEVPAAPTPPSSTHKPSPPSHEPITTPLQAQPAPPLSPPQAQPTTTSASDMPLLNTLIETCTTLSHKFAALEHDKVAQALDIFKLKKRVKKLEKKRGSKSSSLKRLRKVGTSQRVESSTKTVVDAELQRRIERKDYDKAAAKEVNVVEPTVFDDEKMQEKHLDNIKKYQSLKRKLISIAQARKNMIVYLKNMAGYKMTHFKGMTYNHVRPIFEREYNKVQTFLKPNRDEEPSKKRVAKETLLQESFKKLRAEVKVSGSESTQETPTHDPKKMSKEDVKNMLEIILVSEFKVEALQIPHRLLVLKQSFSLSGFGFIQDMETQVDLGVELQGRKDDDNAAYKDVSDAEPTVFDDEEVTMTMAQTLIKMKAEKARLLNEQIAKRLHDEEVEQAAAREKQEQDDLEKAKHLDNIRKYQSLKRKPVFVAQARKNMIIYLKNMAGYKIEHFRGMTYDKVRPIFEREYNKVQTLFKPDKDVEEPQKKRVAEETLLQESFKKLKAVKVSGSESTHDTPTNNPKEISEEDVKNMLEIVPLSEFKVEALQVKEDLDALWRLVKEKFSTTVPNVDKEKALWVELKRHDMFMLTEKNYPLSNGVMTLMLSAKLQVKEDSDMARDLVMKIFMEANKPKSRSLDTSSK